MLLTLVCFSAMAAAAGGTPERRDARGVIHGQLATKTGSASDSEYEYVYENDDDEYEYVYENDDDEYEYVYENDDDDDEYEYVYENDDDEYEYVYGDDEYGYSNGYYQYGAYGYDNEYLGGDQYDYDSDLQVPLLKTIKALKQIQRTRAQRRAQRE